MPHEHVLAALATAYAKRGYTRQFSDQTLTWDRDLRSLRATLERCAGEAADVLDWGLALEFSIPRKEVRLDVVLLAAESVVILEAKTTFSGTQGIKQLQEYALLLHYFHKVSNERRIIPVLVTDDDAAPNIDELSQREFFSQTPSYWIAPVLRSAWVNLADLLLRIRKQSSGQIAISEWERSPYLPVPSIIDAAVALQTGLGIRDIALREASQEEIHAVCTTIEGFVNDAKSKSHHSICFLTGVPGSGKTLVGLSLAHSRESQSNAIHFMSGNGPLVKVLQHLFTQESRRKGASAPQARAEARTLIENVHIFARNYTDDDNGAPSNHALIFDEAQRAWNREQNFKKYKRDYAEPEMLLRIMERHENWAVVIALVGGGQEIHEGEAGLEEWGRALANPTRIRRWTIHASPEVLHGGPSTAGRTLFDGFAPPLPIQVSNSLHLRTSNRSIRAENLASWVNYVLDGKPEAAASLAITKRFPIFVSRDLRQTRATLRRQCRGLSRIGLVGSSGAARLRADGLEPNASFHADYPWEHWYLAEDTDIRSSFQCEVFATEFEIQGLELDWVGLCWGGDCVWAARGEWSMRKLFLGAKPMWKPIKSIEKREFRKNSYRVLLTRARQGMVIFVPRGDEEDPTRSPEEFDATAQFLQSCGVIALPDLR